MVDPLASTAVIGIALPFLLMVNWLALGVELDRFSLYLTMIFSPSIEVLIDARNGGVWSLTFSTFTVPGTLGAELFAAGEPMAKWVPSPDSSMACLSQLVKLCWTDPSMSMPICCHSPSVSS